ncbi:MAG TPA: LysE family translocator [Methylocystis sp.]|nr:LysE family translocator [Methylocystis sp.]
MFDTALFIKAAGIGVAIAAPVGPMSILCMRRTLAGGWRSGLAIGSGIAIADATYGLIAALGLAGVSQFMLSYEKPFHAAAGLLLFYIGLKTFWACRGSEEAKEASLSRGWTRDFATSVLLTLTNPPTIIMFAAIFTALAPSGGLESAGAVATVAGVFTGSLVWWCLVAAVVTLSRRAMSREISIWFDRLAGTVLAAFGVIEFCRAL